MAVCPVVRCLAVICAGIGARKFRTTAVDLGDRSVWTDTPADRLRKEQVRPIRSHRGHNYNRKNSIIWRYGNYIEIETEGERA